MYASLSGSSSRDGSGGCCPRRTVFAIQVHTATLTTELEDCGMGHTPVAEVEFHRVIVRKSGHYIQVEQPEVAVAAIREVVEAAQH